MIRRSLFITLTFLFLGGIACAGQGAPVENAVTPAAQQVAPARTNARTGSFFAINEVGLGPEGYVALTNFTDVPASLGGLYLCQGAQCFELPNVTVDPGETARVTVGDRAGRGDVIATGATLGELRSSDGEIALLASPDVEDPEAILVYFQWGSTPHALTQTAIDAGLWVEGGYGPSSQNAARLFKVEESGLWLFEEP